MNLHDLKPDAGATKRRKRVSGRGISAGKGKTAGRGEKGQNKRSGGGKGPYFEGGQLPLVRRLPYLRGFRNHNRVEYQPINLVDLAKHFDANAEVTPEALKALSLVRDNGMPIKVLGGGDIESSYTVKAHGFSASAREKIEAAGGTVEVLKF